MTRWLLALLAALSFAPMAQAVDEADLLPIDEAFALTATATDRLDLLAHRFYRDPTKFWRICDASDHLDPTDVVATNAVVVIPPNK